MDVDVILDEVFNTIDRTCSAVGKGILKSKFFARYQNDADPMESILRDVGKTMTGAFDKVEPTIQKIRGNAYDAIYAGYKKAGEPYGATPEGFSQWMREREQQIRGNVVGGAKKTYQTVCDKSSKIEHFAAEEYKRYKANKAEDPLEK